MNIESWKIRSKRLKTDIYALYWASRHPRTPWFAKALAVLIIGYALSPIDLIPDFIPILGYVDDFILVSLGIALLIKIIPGDILEECRTKAEGDLSKEGPRNWVAAMIIILIWILVLYLILTQIWPLISSSKAK